VNVTRATPRTELSIRVWTLVAGVALVAGGYWLNTPRVGYLAFTVAATVATLGIALFWGRGARRWAVATAVALGAFAVVATSSQRDLTRIDADWPAYRALVVERGRAEFQREIAQSLVELQTKARLALDAPAGASEAFASFRTLMADAPEQGIVLYDRGLPFAWGGRLVVPPDSARRASMPTAWIPFA